MRWLFIAALLLVACGASFTSVTNGNVDLQAVQINNELRISHNERRWAAGLTNGIMDEIVVGVDIQAATNWAQMQQSLEAICTSYLNHTNAGVNPYQTTNPVWFTEATWREVAGLHSNGFSRAKTVWPEDWTDNTDAAFTQGVCQAGDILGPWLWKELQDGMSALQYSTDNATWATQTNAYYTNMIDAIVPNPRYGTNDCEGPYDRHVTNWPGSWGSLGWPIDDDPGDGDGVDDLAFYSVWGEIDKTVAPPGPPDYGATSYVVRATRYAPSHFVVPEVTTNVTLTLVRGYTYGVAEALYTDWTSGDPLDLIPVTYHHDGLSAPHANENWWVQLGTISVGTNSNPYHLTVSEPLGAMNVDCSNIVEDIGMSIQAILLRYQWNFQYSN